MDKNENRPGGQPSHPNAGKPAPLKAQPVAKAGAFDEIRFPVRFLIDPQDDLDDYEFLVEVATPDGKQDEGEVQVRGDTLLVRYEPEQLGRHTLRVTADGTSICPPQSFVVRDDGSCQKINANASSSGENAPKPRARPGSAGSTRSNRSSSDETGGGLKRNDSISSSLEQLANATTHYSAPGTPDSEASRRSSVSSQASSGYQESTGNEEDEGEEEEEGDVFGENGDEHGDEDDDEHAYEEPSDTRPSSGGRKGSLRKYLASAGQRSRSPSSPAVGQDRQASSRRQRAVSDSGLTGTKGSAGRSKSPQPHSQPCQVFTSPNGAMFVFLGGTAKKLQNMGQSPSGAMLTRADDGSMWLVKDGQASIYQASSKLKMPMMVGDDNSDVLRCAACYRKLKHKKKRARVDQLHFCRDHFKKLFSRRPAFEHKRFLAEPPRSLAWSDYPSPVANFTGLGFKEYRKAQAEFSKYDPDDTYFVTIGVVKPLLANRLQAHPIKESRVGEFFLASRFNKAIHDMGLHGAAGLTELDFLNLLAMAVREMTREWMKKVSMKMLPLQTSWSTSALEVHQAPGTFSKQFSQYGGQPSKFGLAPGRSSGFKPVSQQQQQQQQHRSAGSRRQSADDDRNSDYAVLRRPHQRMPQREDPEGSADDDDTYDHLHGDDAGDDKGGTYTIYEADEAGKGESDAQDEEDEEGREALAAVLDDDDGEEDDEEDDDDEDDDNEDDDGEEKPNEVGITGNKVADSWMIY